MQAIMTSFNKTEIDSCTDRCITTLHNKNLTPDQLTCFQRCTRNITKAINGQQRFRSDSEDFILKINSL